MQGEKEEGSFPLFMILVTSYSRDVWRKRHVAEPRSESGESSYGATAAPRDGRPRPSAFDITHVCHQAHFGGWTDTLVFLAVPLSGHHPPCLLLSPRAVLAEGA